MNLFFIFGFVEHALNYVELVSSSTNFQWTSNGIKIIWTPLNTAINSIVGSLNSRLNSVETISNSSEIQQSSTDYHFPVCWIPLNSDKLRWVQQEFNGVQRSHQSSTGVQQTGKRKSVELWGSLNFRLTRYWFNGVQCTYNGVQQWGWSWSSMNLQWSSTSKRQSSTLI